MDGMGGCMFGEGVFDDMLGFEGWGKCGQVRSGRLRRYVDEMDGKRDEKLNKNGEQYAINM